MVWWRSSKYCSILILMLGCGESDDASDGSGSGSGSNGASISGSAVAGSGGSGASSTTSDGEAAGISLVDFATEYSLAYCGWLYRCCPSEQLAHLADAPFAFTGSTEEECRTNMAALVTLLIPGFTQAESEGRLTYDPLLAESCIDQLRTSCPPPDELCDRIAQPLVMPGDACTEDTQCIDGSCIGDSDEVDGTCGPLVELGGACQADSDCVSDQCTAGVCVEKAALGESCSSDGSCLSSYCDFTTSECGEVPYSGACEL